MAQSPAGGNRRSRARIVDATIEEELRRSLARELHDRVAQTLTLMLVDLENFKLDQTGRESVLRQVDELQDSTREVLNNLRELLYDLRGETAVGDSLVDALGSLLKRFHEKTGIATQLSVNPGWPARLRASSAANIYRIVEEALANVRSHSGAGRVGVTLQTYSESELAMVVRDDGHGAEADQDRPLLGMGMLGMKERALFLGGRLVIESKAGVGTSVLAVFPMEEKVDVRVGSLNQVPA